MPGSWHESSAQVASTSLGCLAENGETWENEILLILWDGRGSEVRHFEWKKFSFPALLRVKSNLRRITFSEIEIGTDFARYIISATVYVIWWLSIGRNVMCNVHEIGTCLWLERGTNPVHACSALKEERHLFASPSWPFPHNSSLNVAEFDCGFRDCIRGPLM